MLREVPLADVSIVALELVEEFVCSWEASIWFADAGNAIDDELLETVVADEVEQASWEFAEYGILVVFDEVSSGLSGKGKDEVGG
jgi:hypothetical protein